MVVRERDRAVGRFARARVAERRVAEEEVDVAEPAGLPTHPQAVRDERNRRPLDDLHTALKPAFAREHDGAASPVEEEPRQIVVRRLLIVEKDRLDGAEERQRGGEIALAAEERRAAPRAYGEAERPRAGDDRIAIAMEEVVGAVGLDRPPLRDLDALRRRDAGQGRNRDPANPRARVNRHKPRRCEVHRHAGGGARNVLAREADRPGALETGPRLTAAPVVRGPRAVAPFPEDEFVHRVVAHGHRLAAIVRRHQLHAETQTGLKRGRRGRRRLGGGEDAEGLDRHVLLLRRPVDVAVRALGQDLENRIDAVEVDGRRGLPRERVAEHRRVASRAHAPGGRLVPAGHLALRPVVRVRPEAVLGSRPVVGPGGQRPRRREADGKRQAPCDSFHSLFSVLRQCAIRWTP